MIGKLRINLSVFITVICLLLVQQGQTLDHNRERFLAAVSDSPSTEFRVDTTTNNKAIPKVASFPNEKILVVWHSLGPSGVNNQGANYAQWFNPDGTKAGAELGLAISSTEYQILDAMAPLSDDGKFVVVYRAQQLSTGLGTFAQIYNPDGTSLGSRIQVNTDPSSISSPAIASIINDRFIIVWSKKASGASLGIFAQVFNNDGTILGSEFQVNTFSSSGNQDKPAVAILADNKFVIVWQSNGQDGSYNGIFARVFNSDVSPSGTEFQVNTFVLNDQTIPKICSQSDGKFVIVWKSVGQDVSGSGVYAQIFNSDGTKNGAEIRVNTYQSSNQENPDIVSLVGGGFVIVWQSYLQAGSYYEIYGQVYDTNNSPSSSELQINVDTSGSQITPVIASLKNGFIVSWLNDQIADTNYKMYAKLFQCPGSTPNIYNTQCYSACPVVAPFSFDKACRISCPSAFSKIYNGECMGSCPTTAPYLYQNECYSACPSAAPYSYNGICSATCPIVAPKVYNWKCYATCPNEAPYSLEETCYQTCPTTAQNNYDWECYDTCPSIAPNVNNLHTCYKNFEQDWANDANAITEIVMKVVSIINSSSPNYILVSSLSAMLLYIRYLKIDYPEKVRTMFFNQKSELISVSFDMNMPAMIEDSLPTRSLPTTFEQYNLHSSFLFNFWDALMSFLIILAITLAIIILENMTRKRPKINAVIKKLSSILKWNLPLLLICGNFNNVVFYLCLELKTFQSGSMFSIISLVVAILMIIISIFVLNKILTIAKNIKKSQQNPTLKKNWDDYTILYEEYKNTSYFTLTYILIFFLRNSIVDLLITTTYTSPLFQTILLVLFSFTMVAYLALMKPLKSKLQLSQLVFHEFLLLVLNICVFILALMDRSNSKVLNTRENIGTIIIFLNILFSTSNIIFICMDVLSWLITLRKRIKIAKAQGKTSFLQIVKFIFEPQPDLEVKKLSQVKPSNVLTNDASVIKLETMDSSRLQFVKNYQNAVASKKPASKLDSSTYGDLSMSRTLEDPKQNFRTLNVSDVSVLSRTLPRDNSEVMARNWQKKDNNESLIDQLSFKLARKEELGPSKSSKNRRIEYR